MTQTDTAASGPRAPDFRSSPTQRGRAPAASGPWVDLAILGAFTAILATSIVPSHWTSIWMDREFTGTVAALANQLTPDTKLYSDGAHIPLPPLPFLFVRLLTRGHATWLWESSLNFAFQALTLFVSYLALRRLFGWPVPFLAILVSIPTFFSLQKTVLYDSMAQATVALVAFQVTWVLGSDHAHQRRKGRTVCDPLGSGRVLPLFGLALTSAVSLLVKQSTGIGAFLGVTAAILLCDRGSWSSRASRSLVFVASTGLCLAMLIVLLAPWADGGRLIRDIFLTGSEPKGGLVHMAGNLRRYAIDIGRHALVLVLPIAALLLAVTGGAGKTARAQHSLHGKPPGMGPVSLALLSIVTTVGLFTLVTAGPWAPATVLQRTGPLNYVSWAGLLLAALIASRCRWPGFLRGVAEMREPHAFAGVFVVVFTAAVFHSLSQVYFRWTYDNNPLVMIAYATLLAVLLQALASLPKQGFRTGMVVCVCLVLVPLRPWARLGEQLDACRRCTDTWEEVHHLSGARLRPSAAGMRHLVEVVRREARPGEQVLLLPADPNVEAWLERDRPRLSSLFLFADQYWDRYVNADLATLEARPPEVIVIGPVNYWRGFHRMFARNRGVERLIDRITTELLPVCYEPAITVPILHQDTSDAMAVYVRRD